MAGPRRSRRHRGVRERAAPPYPTSAHEGLSGVLFDSDVVIEMLRGRAAVVRATLDLEATGVPTYCTPITWAEVYGGLRPGEEALTRAFFEARGEVLLDARVGRRAGGYLARYAKSHAMDVADALIAAAASVAGLRLWTLNRRHYPMDDVRFFEVPKG